MSKVSPNLTRLTTTYQPVEDRICLSGETQDGRILRIWLTQRLLNRLVPELTAWLQGQHADLPRSDVLQGFRQQAAEQRLEPQPPVAADQTSASYLAVSVDIKRGSEQLRLVWKAGDQGEQAALTLNAEALRQWLSMLRMQARRAEWSLSGWPQWLLAEGTGVAVTASRVH